jgi:DNA invertase Pin-like site-specific DNA recombinase
VADEHVYVDDGISGAEFANRPGFLRLMNAVKPRPPFQLLVMSEESRLGREAIETAYALKQLVTAGVRVFLYLENRERTLDSPTDKIMLSLTAFADELEREKARQRTYDAMVRKAKAGHVTGGKTFGYDNVRSDLGSVRRVINEAEAAVGREIFARCVQGQGRRTIAIALNVAVPRARAPNRGGRWAGVHRPCAKCSMDRFIAAKSFGIGRRSAIPGDRSSNRRALIMNGSGSRRPSFGSCRTKSGRPHTSA